MNKLYLSIFDGRKILRWLFFLIILVNLGTAGAYAQVRVLKGAITDATTGEPLPGVTLKIQNTNNGTTTSSDGLFRLQIPPNAVLLVSFIGYTSQTIKVENESELNIKLVQDSRALDDIVVIGYGTMKKKDLTGSVAQIKPDRIADQNPNTTQDILRGTPGVTVGLEPSAKGGGTIRIRGQRSVYTAGGHSDPLLILDGTIFYGELSEINPDDIDQIDVLKDASAAAVYGAKSANGVILITTKKGKKGKPKINFTSNFGGVTMGLNREVFGPEGYLKYRQDWYTAATYGLNPLTKNYETYQSSLQTQPGFYARPDQLSNYKVSLDQWRAYSVNPGGASDNEIWARRLLLDGVTLSNYLSGQTFDWYKHSFRTGLNHDHNISVSGASDRINYYMSFGYLDNKGVVVGNDYSAVRSNIKVEGKVTAWLEVGANVNFQHRSDGDLAVDWDRQIRSNSPFASYRDANGNLAVNPMGDSFVANRGYNYDFDRQYRELDKAYTTFNTILTAKVRLPLGITYSFNGAPRYQFFHDRYWESASHPNWKGTNGLVNREATSRFDWSYNNTLNWEREFSAKHRFAVTLVQEAEKRQRWMDRIEARNILPSDALGYHETYYGDKNKSSYDSDDIKETADGMLARLFYAYDNRYMITSSVRRDGYSAFGSSNPRATFFSTAIGWTFTNEKFFNWKPMSTGKLRVSWGQNGNRSLSNPYIALANLGAGAGDTMGYIDGNGNLIQYRYLMMDRLANPVLSWEKTEAFNVGLDVGFFNDRITGAFDYYITPTVDMIMNRSLPDFTGVNNITTNLGRVENRGFEITINSRNIQNNTFSWNSTFGLSYYKNTIKKLYGVYDNILDNSGNVIGTKERDDIGNGWFIGQPINSIWNYRVTGIWQVHEEEEAKRYGQRPGDPKVANNFTGDDKVNADGTTSPVYNNNDKEFLGQNTAPVMVSLRNEFEYKNFSLSFNLYSYWGHKSLNGAYLNQTNGGSEVSFLWNAYEREYWTPENPTNDFARMDSKGPTGVNSPNKLYDRSFIRLENVSLAYSLPPKLLSKINLDRLRFFTSVRNVAVWKKDKDWTFWDIETGSIAPRIFTLGFNLTF